jgi:predicted DNA-binding WGR domain protein
MVKKTEKIGGSNYCKKATYKNKVKDKEKGALKLKNKNWYCEDTYNKDENDNDCYFDINKSKGSKCVRRDSKSPQVARQSPQVGITNIEHYLEFKDGGSNKFYNLKLINNLVEITFGKIGTKGRHNTINFNSESEANKFMLTQLTQKKKKGYKEIFKNSSKLHVPPEVKKTPEIKNEGTKSPNNLTANQLREVRLKFFSKKKTSSSKSSLKTIKSSSNNVSSRTSSSDKPSRIIFTETPMLADKFYDSNVDMEFKNSGNYNKKKWITYNGDSGERNGNKWIFTDTPTLYANDPKGWFISEKYDGVRAVWNGRDFTSRSKNIYHAPEWFKKILPTDHSLDGELHCGRGCFQKATGITRHLVPNDKDWTTIKYQVFDIPDPDLVKKPFTERLSKYQEVVKDCCKRWVSIKLPDGVDKPKECPIQLTEQIKVSGIDEAHKIYKSFILKGSEGAMLRPMDNHYEYKRSKKLLKWKPSLDAEAVVIGYNEGTGRLKGILGTFEVQLIDDVTKKVDINKRFRLSGRLTDVFRNKYVFEDGKISDQPKKNNEYPIIGDKVTLSFMEYTNAGIPRQPIFQRIRNEK